MNPDFSLQDAPSWFDIPSAKWLSGPTGGGIYVDKYGSGYGKFYEDRKKPFSDEEKEVMKKFEAEKKKAADEEFKELLKKSQKELNNYMIDLSNNGVDVGSDRMKTIQDHFHQKAIDEITYNNYLENEGPHGYSCNDEQIEYCSKRGLFARTFKKKGKEWDKIEKLGWEDDNGVYHTLGYGHDENKMYPKCMCDTISGGPEISQGRDRKKLTDREVQMIEIKMAMDFKRFQKLNRKGFDKWVHDNKHEILDVLAIAVLILPGGFFYIRRP